MSNKKEAIIGLSVISVFLIGMFAWSAYDRNKYSTKYEPSSPSSDYLEDDSYNTTSYNDSNYSDTATEIDSTSNSDSTNMTVEEVTDNLIYIYMREQYDLLTVNGEYYDAEYHDRRIANKAADKFGITPEEATEIYIRKDYEEFFGK